MMLGYNKNPYPYNWLKLFSHLFWLFVFLSLLAGIVKTMIEQ